MTAGDDAIRLIVAGLGNRTRGDDGIGVYLVESIQYTLPPGVDGVVWEGADAYTLAQELIERERPVLFVDCAQMGAAPGTSRWWPEATANMVLSTAGNSTHGFRLGDGIDLARGLGFEQPLYFFGVQPASIGHGLHLSREVQEACAVLEQSLLSTIDALLMSIEREH